MKRTATHADGWAPAGMGIDQMTGAMDGIRSMMSEAGRNPADLKLVVRGNIQLTPDPLEERYPFVGSWEQILSDIEETRRVGADELFIDPIGASPQEIVSLMERVRAAVG
jgi:alkanesulfonate monooxygenase SsuD/methylene tetrahydromethanopterin reductase-like flavin-dependent oxidoreductase (luciferase family)